MICRKPVAPVSIEVVGWAITPYIIESEERQQGASRNYRRQVPDLLKA